MVLESFKLVEDFVRGRNASAAVALVGCQGILYGPAAFGTTGFFPGAPLVNKDTIFDIASLTKVVGTTTVALTLLQEGVFHLQTELGELMDDIPKDKAHITLEQLLSHTSGLPASAPLYLSASHPSDAIAQIVAAPLEYEPGSQVVYSCLGFILLGHLIQSVTGMQLDELVDQGVLGPLGMQNTFYNPPQAVHSKVAYTEWCPRSRQFLRGRVHDENAQSLGGVSGNAGLFSTAQDLGKFSKMILDGGKAKGHVLLSESTLDLLKTCYTEGLNERRTLGWMLHSKGSSGGDFLSKSAIGHTGFTGTSLWIDTEKELFVVLLTNRVHPVRTNEAIFQLRSAFHNAVAGEFRIN